MAWNSTLAGAILSISNWGNSLRLLTSTAGRMPIMVDKHQVPILLCTLIILLILFIESSFLLALSVSCGSDLHSGSLHPMCSLIDFGAYLGAHSLWFRYNHLHYFSIGFSGCCTPISHGISSYHVSCHIFCVVSLHFSVYLKRYVYIYIYV